MIFCGRIVCDVALPIIFRKLHLLLSTSGTGMVTMVPHSKTLNLVSLAFFICLACFLRPLMARLRFFFHGTSQVLAHSVNFHLRKYPMSCCHPCFPYDMCSENLVNFSPEHLQ